mmetsp:Transcript_18460/g.8609  ORF Transcript_18460/g.8609 Transcript_18460/m.8609 type:complete len:104 (-) Transcript_18460:1312-1623(-)
MLNRKNILFNYKKNRDWSQNLTIVTQLGLTMVGCIFFCFFVGRWFDSLFGTRGVFVTILTILGVIGGATICYREILELTNIDKHQSDIWDQLSRPKKNTAQKP